MNLGLKVWAKAKRHDADSSSKCFMLCGLESIESKASRLSAEDDVRPGASQLQAAVDAPPSFLKKPPVGREVRCPTRARAFVGRERPPVGVASGDGPVHALGQPRLMS